MRGSNYLVFSFVYLLVQQLQWLRHQKCRRLRLQVRSIDLCAKDVCAL